jgi:hypothetical protein
MRVELVRFVVIKPIRYNPSVEELRLEALAPDALSACADRRVHVTIVCPAVMCMAWRSSKRYTSKQCGV